MYEYFEGKIVDKGPASVVVEVNGIGYRFSVSLETAERLRLRETARVFAHLHVRETEHRLFGFHSTEERSLFQLLLTVSGVGPSLAIKLLSGCPHRDLRCIIQAGDIDRLKTIRGVGAKIAQRIIVELRETIRTAGPVDEGEFPGLTSKAWEEALLALIALGYARAAADKALKRACRQCQDSADVEEMVRASLRYL